ncbi:hypothetical protein [Companilactobacillus furfuricola]|uniref:hypothetical protein n=1 Tax=Companilactobacillus furfuricola TaxID=1462575 RepID=UPI000F7AE4AF|nr:hypothetical protein [Companilactobacillus furfuricola]
MKKIFFLSLLAVLSISIYLGGFANDVHAASISFDENTPKTMDVVLDDGGNIIEKIVSKNKIGEANNDFLRGVINFYGGRFVCGTYTYPTQAAWGTKGSWARVYYQYGNSTARASMVAKINTVMLMRAKQQQQLFMGNPVKERQLVIRLTR